MMTHSQTKGSIKSLPCNDTSLEIKGELCPLADKSWVYKDKTTGPLSARVSYMYQM